MTPLNYCRQFQIEADLRLRGGLRPGRIDVWKSAQGECRSAVKYLLPANGIALEDANHRALTDGVVLTLPHELIALEFPVDEPGSNCSKAITIVQQTPTDLLIRPLGFIKGGRWTAHEAMRLDRADPLGRDPDTGAPSFVFCSPPQGVQTFSLGIVRIVFHFLNALACLNVATVRLPRKNDGKVKASIPFDEYHVLTLRNGSRHFAPGAPLGAERSGPREHVRRGHIRRLDSGAVWVNSTVVATGRGRAAVHKDYAMVGT